jgi:hypothetical protein
VWTKQRGISQEGFKCESEYRDFYFVNFYFVKLLLHKKDLNIKLSTGPLICILIDFFLFI